MRVVTESYHNHFWSCSNFSGLEDERLNVHTKFGFVEWWRPASMLTISPWLWVNHRITQHSCVEVPWIHVDENSNSVFESTASHM